MKEATIEIRQQAMVHLPLPCLYVIFKVLGVCVLTH
jgi:hypothetical protein